MPERLITDTLELAAFCDRLANTEFITVDTEFMRERTYWPRLCLVQVAGPDEARAIDALADGIDLAPLLDLLANPEILKVFHAARQDMEIFSLLMERLPAPLFDTQVAAMVCGFGDSVGYETLVAKLVKARVDKSSRFTDWSVRPLSQRQIDYALGDVTHLRVAYEKLARKLSANGHESWLGEEMAVLNDPATYAPEPALAFRRMKARNPSPRTLALLRELAGWRELEARRLDLPRNRVLRDEALVEIAHHAPATIEALERTRGLGRRMAQGAAGQAILEAVRRGQAVAQADCPRPQGKPALPRGLGPVVDLLKVLLKMKCEENQVAQKLVASSADVERIAAEGEAADVAALRGWRRQVFGEDALALRGGATALAADGKRLKLVELDSA
jgi:ribonuclease D